MLAAAAAGSRGDAAARADEMHPDGPAMLYNGLQRGTGGAGNRAPLLGQPPMGPTLHACCMAGGHGGLPASSV